MSQRRRRRRILVITLTSGRVIEVVRPHKPQGLHVCPCCGSELVQPIAWEGPEHEDDPMWYLLVECPNCGWEEDGKFHIEELREFEHELDVGLEELRGGLELLTQVNMADEVDRFLVALHGDHILPEDF